MYLFRDWWELSNYIHKIIPEDNMEILFVSQNLNVYYVNFCGKKKVKNQVTVNCCHKFLYLWLKKSEVFFPAKNYFFFFKFLNSYLNILSSIFLSLIFDRYLVLSLTAGHLSCGIHLKQFVQQWNYKPLTNLLYKFAEQ